MNIRVNATKCQGHGMCNAVAPDLYPLDDFGYCAVREMAVPEAQLAEARRGMQACPEQAIRVTAERT